MKNGDKDGLGNGVQGVEGLNPFIPTRNLAGLRVTADLFLYSIPVLCHLYAIFLDDGE